MSTHLPPLSLERPATRADLARKLLVHADRLEALLDTIPVATEIQLLKRDLSRGHDMLRQAGETNFLSVVCLVEAALALLIWKKYNPTVVAALRDAFAPGTQLGPFTFEDYD